MCSIIKKLLILLLVLLTYCSTLYAKEELIVIKSVSKTAKTFAIRKGIKDGVARGQISLFSTDKASISAKVIEIGRFYSVWQMEAHNASIPFKKGQIVHFTNSLERIWTNIGLFKYLSKQKQIEFKRLRKSKSFSRILISGSFNNTHSENIAEIDDYQPPTRQGFSAEVFYTRKLNKVYEVGGGFRFDSENATLTNPEITIPTTRYFIQGLIVKNFAIDPITFNRFYIAGVIGIGKSTTTIIEELKSGTSLLFPSVKMGRKFNSTAEYSFFTEFVLEHIKSSESFEDGEVHSTSIIASRISLGVAF